VNKGFKESSLPAGLRLIEQAGVWDSSVVNSFTRTLESLNPRILAVQRHHVLVAENQQRVI
jgi:hypothetical protein